MRYNENPVDVIQRVDMAFKYAADTIKLLNSAPDAVKLAEISDETKKELLVYIFCEKNNDEKEGNNGGINKKMQELVRKKKLSQQVKDQRDAASELCQQIGSIYYTTDSTLQYVWYEPILLPLWETPIQTTSRKSARPSSFNKPRFSKKKQFNSRKRPHFQPQQTNKSQNNNPYKRQKVNPPKHIQKRCWRCGKNNHHFNECHARWDYDGNYIGNTRRDIVDMPYRAGYKPQKAHKNKNKKTSQSNQLQSWEKYPSKNPNTKPNTKSNESTNNTSENESMYTLFQELHDRAAAILNQDPQLLQMMKIMQSKCPTPRQ